MAGLLGRVDVVEGTGMSTKRRGLLSAGSISRKGIDMQDRDYPGEIKPKPEGSKTRVNGGEKV